MRVGAARGADLRLLAEILPRIEAAVINPPDTFEEEADDDDNS